MTENEYLLEASKFIELKAAGISPKSYFKAVNKIMDQSTDEDKIKYIDEKIAHLRMQKNKIKKKIQNKISKFTQERIDKTTQDLKRVCDGEKISKIAKERGVFTSSVRDRINRRMGHILYREFETRYWELSFSERQKLIKSKGIYE